MAFISSVPVAVGSYLGRLCGPSDYSGRGRKMAGKGAPHLWVRPLSRKYLHPFPAPQDPVTSETQGARDGLFLARRGAHRWVGAR